MTILQILKSVKTEIFLIRRIQNRMDGFEFLVNSLVLESAIVRLFSDHCDINMKDQGTIQASHCTQWEWHKNTLENGEWNGKEGALELDRPGLCLGSAMY